MVDLVLTDPPYYDAIPYSDLMDYFYVWLRRVSHQHPIISDFYGEILSPKWSEDANDGELIDDASRFAGDQERSKDNYENGMYRVFKNCYQVLAPGGRTVIVFAHKQPDAWETLVSAIIRAGFVVDASWPIQTEMGNRTRAQSSAALSSSVWLVCKKRGLWLARDGTPRYWKTCNNACRSASTTIGMRGFEDRTLCGQPQALPWKPIRGIR